MGKRQPGQILVGLLPLLAFTSGCETLYGTRPLPVLVRDIETKRPLPGAKVQISYPLCDSPFTPPSCTEQTKDDGIARLMAAPSGEVGITLAVTVQGYMSEEKSYSVAMVQGLEPAHFFEKVERRPPAVVVELYAEPRPSVELVLPSGFRGVIKADVQILENAPCPPGQRIFSGAVAPSGRVVVNGPPLLRRAFPGDFRPRFADGTPISQQPKEAELGFWLLRADSSSHCEFFAGTQQEYDSFRLFSPYDGGEPKHSSGDSKQGGRGRGGAGKRNQ